MSERFIPPTAEEVARLRVEADRPLELEAYRARAAVPISEQEREEILELIAWFTRRYPTPAARLRYARQAWARWSRAMPPAAPAKP
jgi:hypothetical protein